MSIPTQASGEHLLIERNIETKQVGPDLFEYDGLWKAGVARGAYGGQVVAQAAFSASQTVDPKYRLHSLHAYFLFAADTSKKVSYQVTRLRDGGSYCTRLVIGNQGQTRVLALLTSFKIQEASPKSLHPPMPNDLITPEDAIPTRGSTIDSLDAACSPPLSSSDRVPDIANPKRSRYSTELRVARESQARDGSALPDDCKHQYTQSTWMKAIQTETSCPVMRRCILVYLSDFDLLGSAAEAMSLRKDTTPKLEMMASLDHTVHLYEDLDPSDWILHHKQPKVAGDGRAVVQSYIYNRSGKLGLTCTQEGVIRPTGSRL